MKTAFGTVVYQEALEFGDEFIESMNCQSADFDIVIINDNCTREQVNELVKKSKHKVIVKDSGDKMTPGELRVEMVLYAKNLQYDLLVSGDFDDKFMENRVEKIQQNYTSEDVFFYNELYDFENHNIMRNLPETTLDIRDIVNYNYLGLSNSALNLKKISVSLLNSMKEDKTGIFDWYFFSRLLIEGGRGKLVRGTGTFYRIHGNNIAGITHKNVSMEMVKKEIQVKINHYEILKKYAAFYEDKLKFYRELEVEAEQERIDLELICKNEFWWGFIEDSSQWKKI